MQDACVWRGLLPERQRQGGAHVAVEGVLSAIDLLGSELLGAPRTGRRRGGMLQSCDARDQSRDRQAHASFGKLTQQFVRHTHALSSTVRFS